MLESPGHPASGPELDLERLTKSFGQAAVLDDLSITVPGGRFTVLLGGSGCGKTTCLRLIAGLEQPSAGRINIGGRDVTALPPSSRGVAMVFQSYALFPHLNVAENILFGLKARGVPRTERDRRLAHAVDLLGIRPLLTRKPGQISGGQQQRVALARACAFSPQVLLFDEPLSNLDAKLRADMRIELRELQHRLGVTSVYVTHDLEEALAMSDHIVVMRDGVIAQAGTPADIYDRPRNAFVADFVGSSNLVSGTLRPDLARDGLIALETQAGLIVHGDPCGRTVGAEPTFSIRTVHLSFSTERPPGEINVWPVRVHRCVFQGDFTQIHVAWGDRDLVIRSAAQQPINEQQAAWISADPRRCVLLEG